MKKITTFIFCALFTTFLYAQNQKRPSLADKPGTFEILSRTDYTAAEWGFAKTEVVANMEEIKKIVSVMRQNEVLKNVKGFNGRARIYQEYTNPKFLYGVPARVSFEFSSFFYNKKGEVVFNTIEPPSWSLYINFNDGNSVSSGGFDAAKGYFTITTKKETVAPGIDLYGDNCYVLYDPKRPPYWLPVTVDEAFAAKREFNDTKQDALTASYMRKFLDDDYASIPVSDRQKPAYAGGNVSGIAASPDFQGEKDMFPRIMKPNPAYWNKNLPKSAVQIITFCCSPDKDYLKKELENCYKHIDSGSGCDLLRFETSFSLEDIQRLQMLIGK